MFLWTTAAAFFSVLLNALFAKINLLPPPKEATELKFVPYSRIAKLYIYIYILPQCPSAMNTSKY